MGVDYRKTRDAYQTLVRDADRLRQERWTKSLNKYRNLFQRTGELSLAFGAGISPLLLVTHRDFAHLHFVLFGAMLYLINGFLAIWISKTRIEAEGREAQLTSLQERPLLLSVINSCEKLIRVPDSEEYKNEYQQNYMALRSFTPSTPKRSHVVLDVDLVLGLFILGSLFVARAVFPFGAIWYWSLILAAVLAITLQAFVTYRRVRDNMQDTAAAQSKFEQIRDDFRRWEERMSD